MVVTKMGVIDLYANRIAAHGGSRRGASHLRESKYIHRHLPDNLSYQNVVLYTMEHGYDIDLEAAQEHAVSQNVAIINSDNLNEKYIFSMPGEDIQCGSLIEWMDNHWLVSERDANTTMYTRAKLVQCNYLLQYVGDDYVVHKQWCYIEDGTKYLTGEFEDRNFVVTRGDSRLSMTIARNKHTIDFGRNERNRFIIDDPESPNHLAYTLTKPFKLGGTFNNEGVYKFVLQEVNTTDFDNLDLNIADYYKYFPVSHGSYGEDYTEDESATEPKGWL